MPYVNIKITDAPQHERNGKAREIFRVANECFRLEGDIQGPIESATQCQFPQAVRGPGDSLGRHRFEHRGAIVGHAACLCCQPSCVMN